MSREKLFLALDQGGHASRAIVFDAGGRLIASGSQTVEERHPGKDRVELDPEKLVDSVRKAIRQALQQLGPKAQNLVSCGLATQRSSIVCWDRRTGAPLSPVLSWQDRRAHSWMEQLSPHAERVHEATGLYLSPHYGASKMRWCLENLSSVKKAHEEQRLFLGPLASFLIFRLVQGSPFLVDPANASRTLLWNLRTQDWDPFLLSLFGIPKDLLPRCVLTSFPFGDLDLDNKHIPLKIVTGDQSAALFSLGNPKTNTLYMNLGTGAFLQKPTPKRPKNISRLLASLVYQDEKEQTFVLEGTVNGAGSALKNTQSQEKIEDLEAKLPLWLERESSPPLFLNGVSGLGSPFWVPNFPSRFIGNGEPWEKAVAVAESILFLLQINMEAIQKISSPCSRIFLSGGLAKLNGLCQRLADLSTLPVYRPEECEATARGTAFLLAGRPLEWPEPGPGTWFYPKENTPLKSRFSRWREELDRALRS